MCQNFDDDIKQFKEDIYRKNKLEALLKVTEQDLIQEKLKLNQLIAVLRKENEDVERLESDSIKALFYSVLGSQKEQLIKERQEALGARLRYDECKRNVEYLVDETKRIVDELSRIENCEDKYNELLRRKLEKLSAENRESIQHIKKLIQRRETMSRNLVEINEAIEAGENALACVENTIKTLNDADNWGIWDMPDGSQPTMCDKVDEAKAHAEEAQRLLGRFRREVSDIRMITGSEMTISPFETFADYFFDGLIYDWVVQSEICKSLDSVKNTKNQVDRMLSRLYEEKVTEEFMMQQMDEQINKEIEKA